jgi:TPR repeat protein
MFSFSKAWEKFTTAATSGQVLAQYNMGVMHFTGLGTFKACNVANQFLKLVALQGQHSLDLDRAYKLVE